jgi:hypothetical protein
MKKPLIPLFILALPLAACVPGATCTEEASPSVMVEVVDEAGNIIDDAVVQFDDGSGPQDCWGGGANYACGTEQAGELDIIVGALGFAEQTVSVFVEEDECHVITADLVVELVAEVEE